jgi:hypothetical protein
MALFDRQDGRTGRVDHDNRLGLRLIGSWSPPMSRRESRSNGSVAMGDSKTGCKGSGSKMKLTRYSNTGRLPAPDELKSTKGISIL